MYVDRGIQMLLFKRRHSNLGGDLVSRSQTTALHDIVVLALPNVSIACREEGVLIMVPWVLISR